MRLQSTLLTKEAIHEQAEAAHNKHNTVNPRMREAFAKAWEEVSDEKSTSADEEEESATDLQ